MGDYMGEIRKLLALHGYSGLVNWVEIPNTMVGSDNQTAAFVTARGGNAKMVFQGARCRSTIHCLDKVSAEPVAQGDGDSSLMTMPTTAIRCFETVRPAHATAPSREEGRERQNEAAWTAGGQQGDLPHAPSSVAPPRSEEHSSGQPSRKRRRDSRSEPSRDLDPVLWPYTS
ncbi:hypothetical protein BDV06DRAFT_227463 [Aspergillus oleicola]